MEREEIFNSFERAKLKNIGIPDEILNTLEHCSFHQAKSGLEYFDRRTGLHYLFDEIPLSPPSSGPRYLSIALTNKCNLSCDFCYVDKKKEHTLDLEFLKCIIKDAEENGVLAISFGGGEPTLYPHLLEVLKYTHDETTLGVGLTSNCSKELLDLTPSIHSYVDFLRLSMDGIGSTYKKHRKVEFSEFQKRVEYLRSYYKIGINYLVDEETVEELDDAYSLLLGLNVRELLLLPIEPDCPEHVLSKLYKWIEKNKKGKIRIEISRNRKGPLNVLMPYLEDDDSLNYAHIDAKGLLKESSYHHAGLNLNNYYSKRSPSGGVSEYVFILFRSLYEGGLELDGTIEIIAKFPYKHLVEEYLKRLDSLKAEAEKYMENTWNSGEEIHPQIKGCDSLSNYFPDYFLLYALSYKLKRLDDYTIRIETKAKSHSEFLYLLFSYHAMVRVRYIEGERK